MEARSKRKMCGARARRVRFPDSSDASSTYAPVVEFKDEQGGAHTFVDSLSSSPPSYRVGEAVGVLYNPRNLWQAQIDRGAGNYGLAILLGCAGVLSIVLGFYAARRSRAFV